VRYLEDCVDKLKAQREGGHSPPSPATEGSAGRDASTHTAAAEHLHHHHHHYHPPIRPEQHESADVEMAGSELPSPTSTANNPAGRSNQPSVSPALLAQDAARHRHDSYSSAASAENSRRYSYSISTNTSPAFGPQVYGAAYARSSASASGSTLTSPALQPQRDLDQEATAALLMLNSDRRSTNGSGRGMSVRDLLST